MREKLLMSIAKFAEKRPGTMFLIAVVVTIVATGLSESLKLEMQFKNLMPQNHPMVKEFNQVVEDYSTASMIIIAASGKERELKQFADELAPKVEAIKEYVQRVEYKLETDFFLKHGFMLQKASDLKNMKDIYKDLSLLPMITNLNDSFEKEYVQDEESISTKEKENNAVMFLDGIQYWLNTIRKSIRQGENMAALETETAVKRFLIGDEYFLSQDKDMLLIFAQPTFTVNDIDKVVDAENAIDGLIADVSAKYPSIFAGTTGTIALSRDEMVASSQDMYWTSLIAFVLIIALFIVSFRMLSAPILAGITLLMGVIWAAGFSAITVHTLNIMTSMFAVILIGLGVDFSIHIISVYNENRAIGLDIGESLEHALLKSGDGIITGALTTACAFLTLMISETKGMYEFGLVAGSGVIFCMLSTLFVLPAMLSLRDKILIKLRKEKHTARSTEFRFLGMMGETISRRSLLFVSIAIVITALLLLSAFNLTFDYNYLNMEPVGLTSIKLQHQMEDEFDVTPDFAVITTSSVEEARQIADEAKKLNMIGMVTSISEYVPSAEQQAARIPYIQEIRDNLNANQKITVLSEGNFKVFHDQLKRLQDNIIELAQLAFLGGQDKVDKKCQQIIGDIENPENQTLIDSLIAELDIDRVKSMNNLNVFQNHYLPYFRETTLGMASLQTITVDNLPQNITDQFINKNGDKFLVTIYPKEAVWNLEFLKRFTDQMQKLDERVTGMPTVFYVLMQKIGKDGKNAAMLSLVVIFFLLLLDFKNLRIVVLAMTPLLIGVVWMLGTMQLFGLQLTMVNIMGLPLILGIGIDDGVHILHRYRIEGAKKIRTVFTSTGRAVLLTSLTTMLAFGSLKFATYRGLGSLGTALFIGVGTCFLTSVIILPALLGWMDRREKNQEQSE